MKRYIALVGVAAMFSGCAVQSNGSAGITLSADAKRDRAQCSKAAIAGPISTLLGFPAFVSFDRDAFDRCMGKRAGAGRQTPS